MIMMVVVVGRIVIVIIDYRWRVRWMIRVIMVGEEEGGNVEGGGIF